MSQLLRLKLNNAPQFNLSSRRLIRSKSVMKVGFAVKKFFPVYNAPSGVSIVAAAKFPSSSGDEEDELGIQGVPNWVFSEASSRSTKEEKKPPSSPLSVIDLLVEAHRKELIANINALFPSGRAPEAAFVQQKEFTESFTQGDRIAFQLGLTINRVLFNSLRYVNIFFNGLGIRGMDVIITSIAFRLFNASILTFLLPKLPPDEEEEEGGRH